MSISTEGPSPNRMPGHEEGVARPRVLIATAATLSFVSFWRGAAVVLTAFLSSAFYIGGLAEDAIGKSAPWYILGTLVMACAVSSIYLESSSLFVRNGYREVIPAIGAHFAKISTSTLMLDYILIGPVRGVVAGQYLAGIVIEAYQLLVSHRWLPAGLIDENRAEPLKNGIAMIFCIVVIMYYWWRRTLGSNKADEWPFRVMKITTTMVILLIVWGIFSVVDVGAHFPPLPLPVNLHFSKNALGLLSGSGVATALGYFGILMAFGHSVLAMSGEETLAEVNRDIEHPKLKNLKLTAMIIAIYGFAFAGLASLLAVMLIPDSVRIPVYGDNLIGGLAMYLVGPLTLRLLMRLLVVSVAIMILSGAVNTSLITAGDFINRVAEDGILPAWFRLKHQRFGTPYRTIALVASLQIFTILVSHGSFIFLAQIYSFSVIWTFAIKGSVVLMNRLRASTEASFKVPLNFRLGASEIPLGLIAITLALFAIALVNLLIQPAGAACGLLFTVTSYATFAVSERFNRVKSTSRSNSFSFESSEDLRQALEVRPGCVLVCLRDYNTIFNLEAIMDTVDPDQQDVVAVFFRDAAPLNTNDLHAASQDLLTHNEDQAFARAHNVAESKGQHVHLAVVSNTDLWRGITETAVSLSASAVVLGINPHLTPRQEFLLASKAWENLPGPKNQFTAYVYTRDSHRHSFHVGPHAPSLAPDAILLVHDLWLRLTDDLHSEDLHHDEVVALALLTLKDAIGGKEQDEAMAKLRECLREIRSADHLIDRRQ